MSGSESLVVWGIVAVFALFAAVLAWAENYSKGAR